MTGVRRISVVLILTGVVAGGCSRSKKCPEGMNIVADRSQDGKVLWCKSSDGKLARWIEFYEGTDRRQSCGYSGGKPEGSFTAWHAGGKPWLEGEYRDGRKNGRWTQWDKTGAKVADGEYRNGDFVGGAPVGIPAACEKMSP